MPDSQTELRNRLRESKVCWRCWARAREHQLSMLCVEQTPSATEECRAALGSLPLGRQAGGGGEAGEGGGEG